jgi:DnaJ-like protein
MPLESAITVVSMPYESWVERQIREATERGDFDNLPGAGRPLPGLNGRDDEDWWLKGFLEREKIPMPLPTSLALRKEITDLPQTLAEVRTEDEVRRIVEDLNERIRDSHRRKVDGPALVHRPVDVEATVTEWKASRKR